ncbi:SGNH/GDSL hydrolase family protein [Actinoplanes sp. NPDC023801]|uniref:SGNH/GDSL hydrolase family protein n=1 Tax=Actinoplanes sp. NPDC023801 TaxID=3154595 RepID=UPI0033DE59C3
MRRAALLLLLLAGGCSPPAPAPGPATPPPSASPSPAIQPWTGTWATAVEDGGRPFGGHTLRQVVRASIGGDISRIRLTNEFGDRPLVVGAARLARPDGVAAIDPATDRAVTFGGATSVTVAPGGTATSDEVPFGVPAGSEVVISLFLPSPTGPSTRHGIAVRHNHVAAGDQTSAVRLASPKTESSWFYLAGLDVRSDAGAVVAFGASITDGLGSAFGANRRWPDLLSDRLRAAGHRAGVLNAGISGNRLLADGRGPSGVRRFERDVLRQPGVRWVIISDDPLNDLGAADPPSADRLITALRGLVSRAQGAGVRTICSTLTPYEGAGYWTRRGEAARAAINAFVRSPDSGCDAVLDQDAVTRDPARPLRYLPRHDSGDHLHPSADGFRAIAGAVDPSWFTVREGTPPAPGVSGGPASGQPGAVMRPAAGD